MKVKKVSVLIFLFLAFSVRADQILFREEYPPAPVGYMNDFGNFLSPEEREEIENELRDFQDNYDLKIVVITVSKLNGKTGLSYLEGYARKRKLQDEHIILLFSYTGPKEWTAAIMADSGIREVLERKDFFNIIQNDFVPYLDEGRTNKAIIKSIKSILSHIVRQRAGSLINPVIPAFDGFFSFCRGVENRTPAARPPASRTAIIRRPAFARRSELWRASPLARAGEEHYFLFPNVLMHLAQAKILLPANWR